MARTVERSVDVAPGVDPASRWPRVRRPQSVLVGLAEPPRDSLAGATAHDSAALEAGTMLARSFRCTCEPLHVPFDVEGAPRADEGLLDAVDARLDPLLVLGSRHRIPAAGRTTRGVLSSLPCPVWIQRGHWTPPGRVLVAMADFHVDRDVFDIALDLAASLGVRLDVVHCREHPGDGPRTITHADLELLVDVARERATREDVTTMDVGLLEVAGPARVALAPYLERADLTVLGRGTRRGLGHVLHDLVIHRRGPFVVVP